jgi:uncharacterized protein YjaG (DUF416 family)
MITRKQLALYLGVCRQTASKQYQMYIDILDLKRNFLTVRDIAEIDNKSEDFIRKEMHIKSMNYKKC